MYNENTDLDTYFMYKTDLHSEPKIILASDKSSKNCGLQVLGFELQSSNSILEIAVDPPE